MQVDYPVHEVETNETDWKDDSRVFVDIRWRNTCEKHGFYKNLNIFKNRIFRVDYDIGKLQGMRANKRFNPFFGFMT